MAEQLRVRIGSDERAEGGARDEDETSQTREDGVRREAAVTIRLPMGLIKRRRELSERHVTNTRMSGDGSSRTWRSVFGRREDSMTASFGSGAPAAHRPFTTHA